MVLEGLAVGDADGAVEGVFAGKFVNAQPLLRGDDAPRQAAAQHHAFQRFEFLFGTFGAQVAVVLFVHAVEADELEVVTAKGAGDAVAEVGGNAAVQVVAFVFEAFVVGIGRVGQFGARVVGVAHDGFLGFVWRGYGRG